MLVCNNSKKLIDAGISKKIYWEVGVEEREKVQTVYMYI